LVLEGIEAQMLALLFLENIVSQIVSNNVVRVYGVKGNVLVSI
jgi:hypothetical protein